MKIQQVLSVLQHMVLKSCALEHAKWHGFWREILKRILFYTCTCADAAASPERYKQFMAILCGYIVEKQREVQGEELPFDLVFVSHYSTSQMQIYMPWQWKSYMYMYMLSARGYSYNFISLIPFLY